MSDEVATDEERVERWCRLLLNRYGVVCRDLMKRETLAPSWVSLAMLYRRWEARGEVRGGRFVAGLSGEQFALPEIVDELRATRDKGDSGEFLVFSGADPLNLRGVLTPGDRLPALGKNRLVVCAGEVIATRSGADYEFAEGMEVSRRDIVTRAMRLHGFVRHRDPFLNSFRRPTAVEPISTINPLPGTDLRSRLRVTRH